MKITRGRYGYVLHLGKTKYRYSSVYALFHRLERLGLEGLGLLKFISETTGGKVELEQPNGGIVNLGDKRVIVFSHRHKIQFSIRRGRLGYTNRYGIYRISGGLSNTLKVLDNIEKRLSKLVKVISRNGFMVFRTVPAPFRLGMVTYGVGRYKGLLIEVAERGDNVVIYIYGANTEYFPYSGCCGKQYNIIEGGSDTIADKLVNFVNSYLNCTSPEIDKPSFTPHRALYITDFYELNKFLREHGWKMPKNAIPYEKILVNPSLTTVIAYNTILHGDFLMEKAIRGAIKRINQAGFFYAVKQYKVNSYHRIPVQYIPAPRKIWIVYLPKSAPIKTGIPVAGVDLDTAIDLALQNGDVYSKFVRLLGRATIPYMRLYQVSGYSVIYKQSQPPQPITLNEIMEDGVNHYLLMEQ